MDLAVVVDFKSHRIAHGVSNKSKNILDVGKKHL
jgi:hypothetical protein